MIISKQIEEILQPVRLAVARGEALSRFCKRRGVSYTAVYHLLTGTGTLRLSTLTRLHQTLVQPDLDIRLTLTTPIRSVETDIIPDGLDLSPLTILKIPRGGGATTILDLIETSWDPAGPGWARLTNRVWSLRVRSDRDAVDLQVEPIRSGPHQGGFHLTGAGLFQHYQEQGETTELDHTIWPSLMPARICVRPDLSGPFEESDWIRVRKSPALQDLFEHLGYPCTKTPPRSEQAWRIAHLIDQCEAGSPLVLLDRPELILSVPVGIRILSILTHLHLTRRVGQVVWATDQPDLIEAAVKLGWVVPKLKPIRDR